ncbi:hypothetical protein UN64_09235 [Fictibacillus arsenicus]|uniref:Uncharacterized protein n=1 Tax=Fictibacillus arsenicus TaxID=255247 RepID=A0A1V3G773_9BACL|nr:hypothetical protein UN64_09235 [Fictibacillus arsenicus]
MLSFPFYLDKKLFSYTLLLLKVVDFHSRMLAFLGACGEPTRCFATLNGLTCPADPAGVSHLALQSTCK